MKVHLLRSWELDAEKFGNVLNLLKQFRGPVDFLPAGWESEWDETAMGNRPDDSILMDTPEEALKEKDLLTSTEVETHQPWDYFFSICNKYRLERNIAAEDHLFLLTEMGNDRNWFGAVGPSTRDYFIQTSGWHHYFGQQVDERFPIAYEVVIWLIRRLMFDNHTDILHAVHRETRGCGNDFCQHKKEIILKMRTADLCPNCMHILAQRHITPSVLPQLFDIMDSIRSGLTFRERIQIIRRPSRLEIRGHIQRMFLTDLGDLELRFNPKEKAIYLFYLRHPEGVHLTSLRDFRPEINGYYQRFTNQEEPLEIHRAVDRLLDPLDNDIHVVLSRIKRKLREAVGEELLHFYMIDGPHGGDKRIPLDRSFVWSRTNEL